MKFENVLHSHGCVVVGEYVNTMTKIKIKCKCGTIFEKRPNDCIKSKLNQCEKCRYGYKIDNIDNYITNYKISTKVSEGNRKYYEFNCDECGSVIKKSRSKFLGKRKDKNLTKCKECISKRSAKKRLNDINEVKSFLCERGSDLAGDYTGAKNLINVRCECGSEFKRQWNSIKYYESTKCIKCSKKQSNFEKEVKDFIESLNIEFIQNSKNIINPYELDIFIESHNTAIECNGVYWHSELLGKDKNYHLNKTNLCASRGISLIHIFDLIWNTKKDAYKSIIRSKLGLNKSIYARNCKVVNVDPSLEKSFLNANHLQGYIHSSTCLGLEYDGELVMILSLKKPRYNKQYDFEILRVCSLSGITVVGGLGKLIKPYRNNKVITYSDKCIGSGSAYKTIGMKELKDSAPSYHYHKNGQLFNRLKFQKYKLSKVLEEYDQNKTEWENMIINGYDRFWDCGNKVFSFY
jgi:hypothetical protein